MLFFLAISIFSSLLRSIKNVLTKVHPRRRVKESVVSAGSNHWSRTRPLTIAGGSPLPARDRQPLIVEILAENPSALNRFKTSLNEAIH